MRNLPHSLKAGLVALVFAATAFMTAQPAAAHKVHLGIQIGVPGFHFGAFPQFNHHNHGHYHSPHHGHYQQARRVCGKRLVRKWSNRKYRYIKVWRRTCWYQ